MYFYSNKSLKVFSLQTDLSYKFYNVIMVPEEGLDGVRYGIQFNRCLFVRLKSGD